MENNVNDCEACINFARIGTDHLIYTATICLSLRFDVKHNKRKIYDWSTLKDPEISKEYSNTVKHIYDDLNI